MKTNWFIKTRNYRVTSSSNPVWLKSFQNKIRNFCSTKFPSQNLNIKVINQEKMKLEVLFQRNLTSGDFLRTGLCCLNKSRKKQKINPTYRPELWIFACLIVSPTCIASFLCFSWYTDSTEVKIIKMMKVRKIF